MNIQVHIERLILDGIPVQSSQLPALRAAVEKALGDRLMTEGLSPGPSNSAVSEIPGTTFHLSDPTNAGQSGKEIAQAVYNAIGQRGL